MKSLQGWFTAVALLGVLGVSAAFKEHDFKKCHDSGFCKRLRGASSTHFAVSVSSVKIQNNILTAELKNVPEDKDLVLQVLPYKHMFRIKVAESGSSRYELPDVLVQTPRSQKISGDIGKSSATITTDAGSKLTLHYDPMRIEIPGQMVLNARDMFQFEHKRDRSDSDVDGMWEETFKGHKDSKPRGPQAMSVDLSFPGSTHVYGIPEHAGRLALKPTVGVNITSEPYRLYNLDVFEYLEDSPFGLYGSIPFLTAISAEHAVGFFWLNAAEMYIDVEKKSDRIDVQWLTESGAFDVFLLLGPKPADVLQQYTSLTGTSAMPQMFSIGYHQCRWNYKDEADVRLVNEGFDDNTMPCDVIWLDIEHTDGKRYMTWDSSKFPTPMDMLKGVSAVGRKMVTIVDPHVKRDDTYSLHKQATNLRYYVRNNEGNDFEGWCWPGSSSYLDVVDPKIRQWWANFFTTSQYKGSTPDLYIWNDMNEPSVFNGPEITMPKDALHMGSVEHRDIHNVYGLYYHQATAAGLQVRGAQANPPHGDRPFVLSRAFFSGTQRIGPVWTGDNAASWSHLQVAFPMLLSMGVAGLPNVGADVGGFFGNPDVELLQRWYQAGIFYPFFRAHAHLDAKRREPWLFGDEVSSRLRAALRERYALLPYLYTLFRAANETGEPILRPMLYDFPTQPALFDVDHQAMFGSGMIVAPVVESGAQSVQVMLPSGEVFYTPQGGKVVPPKAGVFSWRMPVTLDTIPRLYRGGHIIPRRDRPRRSTRAQRRDPYTLLVALDTNGSAKGRLYIDDGKSFAFRSGHYIDAQMSFQNGVLEYTPTHVGEQYSLYIERVVVLGWPFKAPKAKYAARTHNGVELEVTREAVDGSTDANALVVRDPHTPVVTPWSLKISEF